ncbi:tetratricopeptide repeat protein [Paucibacter sp. JuS9]|uniref:tetratricopeptide repeat protein n=1 Tax=Roseateles TaxID=93681 RepID=UPI002FE5D5CF
MKLRYLPLTAFLLCSLNLHIVMAEPIAAQAGAKPASASGLLAAQAKLEQGLAALAKRDHEKARALFQAATKLAPYWPEPWLQLAESARVANQPELVNKWLTEALRVAPDDPATLSAWGSLHYARGEYQKAESFKQAALKADPRATNVLVDLGDLYFNVHGKPDVAADYFRRALVINPKLGGAHNALGTMLLLTGKAGQAIDSFTESARLAPTNPLPVLGLARAQAQTGNTSAALASYDQALKLSPGLIDAYLGKGDLLLNQGKPDAALRSFADAVKANPRSSLAYLKLGMAQQMQNRSDEAMAAYKEAVRLSPQMAVGFNNLAWLAAERSDVADKGLAWAKQAVALNGEEPRFKGTLAWVHFKRGESAEAIKLLEPLVRGNAKALPETHYLLGQVYAGSGDKAKAKAAIQAALELDPRFSQAEQARASLRQLDRP